MSPCIQPPICSFFYCDSAASYMVVVKVLSQASSGPWKPSDQRSFFLVIFLLIALFLEVSLLFLYLSHFPSHHLLLPLPHPLVHFKYWCSLSSTAASLYLLLLSLMIVFHPLSEHKRALITLLSHTPVSCGSVLSSELFTELYIQIANLHLFNVAWISPTHSLPQHIQNKMYLLPPKLVIPLVFISYCG